MKSTLLSLKTGLALLLLSYIGVALYASDFFELGPIHYSATQPDNKVSRLSEKSFINREESVTDLEILKKILNELNIPEASQLLVYSKTSAQKKRIFPRYPRALYFSDSCYVGYVPGGTIEVTAHDPKLGLVFYTISPDSSDKKNGIKIKRQESCLSCHVSARTRNVPGLFVRSVSTDDKGEVDLKKEGFNVDDKTSLAHRWGGWYVTGNWSGIKHMGNDFNGESPLQKLKNVRDRIEADRYVKDTSDIAALMVFEHQCKMHTILIESSFQYRRALHLEKALHPDEIVAPKDSSAFKVAKNSAEEIVEGLLFCDEAKIEGDGIEGDEAFEKAFIADAKLSKSGKHLRKFRLYGRLFKYRCSYMIHSPAFASLPEPVKKATFKRLYEILTQETPEEKYQHLKTREKKTILEIIKDTTPIMKYAK